MIGLLSWLGIGLVVGVAARFLLPGQASWLVSTVASLLGAVAGGVLATVLEMGGLAELDPRALVLAFLLAVLTVLLAQLVRVMRDRPEA